MVYYTIQIEETDYRYLEHKAKAAGLSIQLFLKQLITRQQLHEQGELRETNKEDQVAPQKSRWAQCSERIRKNPPLRGAGEYVRQCSQEFRQDFIFKHDEEKPL